jgi:hypothetical protein
MALAIVGAHFVSAADGSEIEFRRLEIISREIIRDRTRAAQRGICMNVFEIRDRLIRDSASYVSSFIQIRDKRIADHVERSLGDGLLWPEPLIQLNPSFEPGDWIDDLVRQGVLYQECSQAFRTGKDNNSTGKSLRLHRHQSDAVRVIRPRR